MPQPQSLNNHTRFDPPFHFFLAPILLINLILTIFIAVHLWSRDLPLERFIHLWIVVLAVAFLFLAGMMRSYSLKVQDRVIRLEERLRLTALLAGPDQARIPELSVRQLVALRFASDAEIPALVHKTLSQGLDAKAIKQNIVTWRPDDHRV